MDVGNDNIRISAVAGSDDGIIADHLYKGVDAGKVQIDPLILSVNGRWELFS